MFSPFNMQKLIFEFFMLMHSIYFLYFVDISNKSFRRLFGISS